MFKMVCVFLGYAIALMVAGHGVLPMAMVLALALPQSAMAVALSLTAVVIVLVAFLWARKGSLAQLWALLAGVVLLYGAWICNVLHFVQLNSEAEQTAALQSMALFSLPFQVASLWAAGTIVVNLKRAFSSPRGSDSA